MKMQEFNGEEMYCLVAPDGIPQLATLCPDYASCIGFIQFMADRGMSKIFSEMLDAGFEILPVKLTITQNGTAQDAFEKGKAAIQNSDKG